MIFKKMTYNKANKNKKLQRCVTILQYEYTI